MSLPLFVYGTLLSGEGPAAALLAGLGRREARARGTLWRLPAGYPAFVPGPDGDVHGELVDAPSERVLALVDAYEGVGQGLYERVQADVIVHLRTVAAWTYVMTAPEKQGGVPVPNGRWRSVRRS